MTLVLTLIWACSLAWIGRQPSIREFYSLKGAGYRGFESLQAHITLRVSGKAANAVPCRGTDRGFESLLALIFFQEFFLESKYIYVQQNLTLFHRNQ